jgi:hypothetical protein
MAELLHGRDDAHRDTRTRTPPAEAGLARRVEVSPLARVCRQGEIVLRGASCPRCQVEKLERTRLRGTTTARGYGSAQRSAAEEARSPRRQRADAVCPLRRFHPSGHAVRPPRRRRPDAIPGPRACRLQSRRGWNAAEPRPNDLLHESEPERRMPVRREDVGASAGGQSWGMRQPAEGVAAVGRDVLPCSPPRSHFNSAASRERGRSQGRLVGPNCQGRRSGPTVQCPRPRTPRLSVE